MPDDMRHVIVSKVGAISSIDYYNTIISCKALNFTSHPSIITTPSSLARHSTSHLTTTLSSSLRANNIEAHYIKGIVEYFRTENKFLGLHHLQLTLATIKEHIFVLLSRCAWHD
ncbi:unnamed protein product [Eruca vesicaria subsp. sativa]|uniref:Uncharacterized protein n=1 Tax=Eruca vesicaria subsp. sativa TaxID=29727 RepID=A0ABC8M6T6_ERUVS|nr:unnamed protein product [Eruca vesicaria subsp. sativa]